MKRHARLTVHRSGAGPAAPDNVPELRLLARAYEELSAELDQLRAARDSLLRRPRLGRPVRGEI